MKPDERRLFWIVVLLTTVLAAVMLQTKSNTCSATMVAEAIKKQEASSCWEFWLNRYQTLIGSLVAIGAAALAWHMTQRQIATERVKTLRQDLYTTRRVRTLNSRITKYLAPLLDVGRVRKAGEVTVAFEPIKRFADDGLADILTEQKDREAVSELYQTLIMSDDVRHATDQFRDVAKRAHQQSKRLFTQVSKAVGLRAEECRPYELILIAETAREACEAALNELNFTNEVVYTALTKEVERLSAEIKTLSR